MKTALIAALLLPLAAWGGESAYQALRIVGEERSKTLLNNVIEVKGRNGASQPDAWTVLLNDPLARGGVREIEVSKGRIVSERTPVKAYSGQGEGSLLNFTLLNLDSDGAFAVAEAEARNAKIGFYGADYLLRSGENGAAPLWVVQLLDRQQHSLGSVNIAADTGAVIEKTFGGKAAKGAWAAGGGLKGRLVRFSDAVGRSLRHAGGSAEEFLTGERTLDKPGQ
ncbi:MAG: hypothetical protein WCO68_03390 [Verrucomicrobiota bacterium]